MRILPIMVLLAALAGAAQAQDDPGPARPVTIGYDPNSPSFYLLTIEGHPQVPLDDKTERLRRAAPAGQLEALVRHDDASIERHLDDPAQPKIYSPLRVEIDGTGRISACASTPGVNLTSEGRAFAAEICPVLTHRARFRPSLDMNGVPVPDVFRIEFNFSATRASWVSRSRPATQKGDVPQAI